jgi:hypothetical protein
MDILFRRRSESVRKMKTNINLHTDEIIISKKLTRVYTDNFDAIIRKYYKILTEPQEINEIAGADLRLKSQISKPCRNVGLYLL